MTRNSIFLKLASSYLLVILIVLPVIGGLELFLIRDYFLKNKERELLVRSRELVSIVRPILLKKEDPRSVIVSFNQADRILGTEFWVMDKNGKVLAAAADHLYCEGNTLEFADLEQLRRGHVSLTRGQSQYFKEAVIRAAAPILNNKELLGAVILFAPVTGVNETTGKMIQIYVGAAVLGVIIAALLGILLSRLITRPVLEASHVASKIAEGNFDEKVRISSRDELGKLGNAINNMTERLAKSEKLRRDFIANVSHELRSPLTSVQGFVDALLEGRDTDEQDRRRYLNIIQTETNRLGKLVNDLLEISRFDSEGISFDMGPFPIGNVINRAVASLKPQFDIKRISVRTVLPKELPQCYGDEDRIEQVLHNLLENAIRYSPDEGKILISCRVIGEEIYVEVADNGPGISTDELPFIWERFYRVDKDRSRLKGGTGLGLAIVREIIKKHGGRVTAESDTGEGAAFGFTLPLA